MLARDRSGGGRVNTGTASIVVEVKDLENRNPIFISENPVTRIPEDTPVKSYVLEGQFNQNSLTNIENPFLNLIFFII